tara:strand:+ start:1895 stop:2065 length:171 start_codon:yes stop_codon:yes gene_type:complete
MSNESASFRSPLEMPSVEYSHEYMLRLVNQLRLNFSSINTSKETNNPIEALEWFIS